MIEVDIAEDLAVSATKYNPFKRPQLGKWLNERHSDFDVLICWRLDRIVRSSYDLAQLLEWCDKHGKNFVSATEGFDLQTPFGRAMATIIAALGQLEAETTRLRVTDSHAKLRTMDRWASGVPPLGFQTVPHPSGRGYGLAPEPEGRAILHAMADKLLDGWSLNGIANWLTDSGHLTNVDRKRQQEGKPVRPWNSDAVKRMLTSPATQGIKVRTAKNARHPGIPVLDDDGMPIRMAAPTFEHGLWERIQEKIREREHTPNRRTHSKNPVLGVGFCECGASLAQFVNEKKLKDGSIRVHRYYRCGGGGRPCTGKSVKADDVDSLLADRFLDLRGDSPVIEQRFIPGSDNREEIELTRGSLDRLRAESDAGLITDNDKYIKRLTALTGRLQELEKEPYTPSRWESVETDKTYREAWEEADSEERRKMLIDAGVRFVLHQGNPLRADIQVP